MDENKAAQLRDAELPGYELPVQDAEEQPNVIIALDNAPFEDAVPTNSGYARLNIPQNRDQALLADLSKDYALFRFPEGYRCPRYEFDPTSARFHQRVRDSLEQRSPVVFSSRTKEDFDTALNWKTSLWTREYLADKVGPAFVKGKKVKRISEPLGSISERKEGFGISFTDFLDSIKNNNSNYYLGIQKRILELGKPHFSDPRQFEAIFGSRAPWYEQAPLSALQDDFSFPQFYIDATGRTELKSKDAYKMNFWMGNLSVPSKSGLHFDTQDNMYFVLSGYKKFNLYTPADGPAFYTARVKVSANGKLSRRTLRTPVSNKPNVDVDDMDIGSFPLFPYTHRQVQQLAYLAIQLVPNNNFGQLMGRCRPIFSGDKLLARQISSQAATTPTKAKP
ncbi:hypothetical protein CYMTET_30460 [Cymbomonas tetramitiformis]|uniref:Cupin-like domain-containing protein n=1 Tax=Cymbomonas tetramitiformis TaxID=36881 RepID=A0AAE0FIY8_9CHLO|nr:hypothetical protein CYMTET_30460 [Cymbomonas tetramitiformis]